jgi:hypothetical protein
MRGFSRARSGRKLPILSEKRAIEPELRMLELLCHDSRLLELSRFSLTRPAAAFLRMSGIGRSLLMVRDSIALSHSSYLMIPEDYEEPP